MSGTINRCDLNLTNVPTQSNSRATVSFNLFGDDATAINAVESTNANIGQAYNLNGQRVVAPQKGLYIVNGKKVIVK